MTTEEIFNNVGAFSEYLTSEMVDHIIIAYDKQKVHLAKDNPNKNPLEFMVGAAMIGDKDFRTLIFRAVGFCINYENRMKAYEKK